MEMDLFKLKQGIVLKMYTELYIELFNDQTFTQNLE